MTDEVQQLTRYILEAEQHVYDDGDSPWLRAYLKRLYYMRNMARINKAFGQMSISKNKRR